jgi:hypothetical protein
MTAPSKDSVYSGVVTLRSLRLCMFLEELNGLDVDAADVGSAYVMAYTNKERLYIIAGTEFGDQQGCLLIIVKALYGLRTSSGASWHELFCMILLLKTPAQESFILSTRLLWSAFPRAKRPLKLLPMVPNLLLLALPLNKPWIFVLLYK